MKLIIPALAALMLAAPALAQDAGPGPNPDRAARFAQFHERMCTNLYAHAVGKLATLEVQLKLTSVQKPLFERWKSVKLASVKAASAKCTETKPLDRDASIMEHRQRQIARLETRLANLKSETPALEALVKSLDKDQTETLKQAARHPRMMAMGGRFGRPGPMMQGPMHGPMGGPMMHRHAMLDDGEMAMGADD